MRTVAIVGCLSLAAGCATSPLPDSETKPLAANHVRAPEYLRAQAGYGAVSVKRDAGIWGMQPLHLYVDAVLVADFSPSERAVFYLPPGDHVLAVHGLWTATPEASVHVSADSTSSYRIAVGANNGEVLLTPTRF